MWCLAFVLGLLQLQLASPDRRFLLYGEGPELWIRDERTAERRLLLRLGGTVRAEWAPDGSAFYVADHLASDSTLSYIYDAGGRTRLDVRDVLSKADRGLLPFATGHVYVDTLKWLDSRTILVSYFGHTDEAPVRCFAFRYTVGRTGKVRKLSGRVEPVTERGCPER